MPPVADRPALAARGLAKSYADLVALAPLDLSVAPGSMVALVGHNGSGKSTFLRLVAGILDATEGTVTVDGFAAGSLEARAATSFLPDDPVLYDDLSVREHLDYVSRLHGLDASADDAEEVLDRLGLLPRADDLPARFSRGLRQRTSIALGLFRPFKLLLVDEPFVGLDASGKQALLDLLEELHGHGTTVVVATHDPGFVERVDRCLALRDGQLIHDGSATPADVLRFVSV
jgi:ABC-type multidrug transport system ATPase subunit